MAYNPYSSNQTKRVAIIDSQTGDYKVIHANQQRIDEAIAKGKSLYEGDVNTLYDLAKDGLMNNSSSKDILKGYNTSSQKQINEAKKRLEDLKKWREYAKPVSSPTPLGSNTSVSRSKKKTSSSSSNVKTSSNTVTNNSNSVSTTSFGESNYMKYGLIGLVALFILS